MPDIERFLEPIPGDNPVGTYLRYDPLYARIEEARRKEDPAIIAKMNLGRDAKVADYKQVVQSGEDALLKRTKDLQISAWLAEAWGYRERFPGIKAGLQLTKALLETFWDNVYPQIDEGDLGDRRMPLDWLGSSNDFASTLRGIPLTKNVKHSWYAYQDGRAMGYEKDVSGDKAKKALREDALRQGKVPPEEFDEAFEQADKAYYKALRQDLSEARQALSDLNNFCNDKFSDDPPSFTLLERAFEEVGNVVQTLLLKKLDKDPDPVEVVPPDEPQGDAVEESAPDLPAAVTASRSAKEQLDIPNLGQIKDADQAAMHVIAAAQFLRQRNPASPVSYLLLRALRWGEVRATNGSAPDLPAPPSETRVALKSSAAANQWKRVLETAESAMSRTCGRGWLDLQRYSITACEALGYTEAAKALRSELKSFLLDFPELPIATLNDDTGTANPETMNWLRKQGFIS